MTGLIVTECGDSAIRVMSSAPMPDERWSQVHALANALDADRPAGVHGAIVTYDAVLVEFDCTTTTHDAVRRFVDTASRIGASAETRAPRSFEVPVVYGGVHGPDLDLVASVLGVSSDEVVRIHTSAPLTMRCFGSPGGAPMLDGPAFELPIPRRTSPRPSVPAGAVAVAGRQAVVSARPAPGGWQVLGTTPVELVDITANPLSPFAPGDTFRFVSIDESEWDSYAGALHG
ncbi:5-oxoprolinase subunit B family protein [Rhodococcoides kyotonense]|uniref:Sensor histidine kinase inhibitor, KipI family n=1 Tax=Rhodococcoides kyotonense TaxID=398843 RepID=A0A239JVP0_9NOCA|nr:carboxyltransferase domain-containing protein [Rhodococcus kyotonensis]SNT09612.1 sensor histidine kinase inhibitor, KipI family [Rhodococcus kyotonensis]